MKLRGVATADQGGVGLAPATRDGAWMFHSSLRPFRDPAGQLVDGQATLWFFCADRAALDRQTEAVPAEGSLLEVEVEQPPLLPGLGRPPHPDWELVRLDWRVLDTAADPELVDFAARIAPPARVSDPVLGTLAYDSRLQWYAGPRTTASGQAYRLVLAPDDAREITALLVPARPAVARFEAGLPALLARVAAELHPVWLDGWQQPGQPLLSVEALAARLQLQTLSVRPDGTSSVWLADGDLFGRHGIEVVCDATGEVVEVSMAG